MGGPLTCTNERPAGSAVGSHGRGAPPSSHTPSSRRGVTVGRPLRRVCSWLSVGRQRSRKSLVRLGKARGMSAHAASERRRSHFCCDAKSWEYVFVCLCTQSCSVGEDKVWHGVSGGGGWVGACDVCNQQQWEKAFLESEPEAAQQQRCWRY